MTEERNLPNEPQIGSETPGLLSEGELLAEVQGLRNDWREVTKIIPVFINDHKSRDPKQNMVDNVRTYTFSSPEGDGYQVRDDGNINISINNRGNYRVVEQDEQRRILSVNTRRHGTRDFNLPDRVFRIEEYHTGSKSSGNITVQHYKDGEFIDEDQNTNSTVAEVRNEIESLKTQFGGQSSQEQSPS